LVAAGTSGTAAVFAVLVPAVPRREMAALEVDRPTGVKLRVLLWQMSQGSTVSVWFGGLPSATLPLWQVAQAAVRPEWFNLAPPKVTELLWQVSHAALVATWLAGLPVARPPL